MPTSSDLPRGGGFLIDAFGTHDISIPEDATEDEKNLAKLAYDFAAREVVPHSDEIEASSGVLPTLLKKAGELGLLMAEVPTEYGGLGLGKVPTTFISENITHQGSFSVAFMCHTGIATLPLMAYGTDEQKTKYLPKLATGEWLGAYALTEAGAGSDALGGRAKATLSADGKYYTLSGEKVFITNGGFADLFTVFAKVDGEKLTAFLVEKSFPGVSCGPEEKKMGIHGSSTTPLLLDNAEVPVENVLGEIGKGHRIAFNVLNVGRWKLGAACLGSCKRLMERVIPYIKERQQFGKSISTFGLIRDKVASLAVLTYLSESLVYRFAFMLDAAMSKVEHTDPEFFVKQQKILKEYAIEASVSKVYVSEALQTVADQAVQMFGGYGFCEHYVVERFYRDCRINRIFEGTNEINQLIIANTLIKRAMAGDLPLLQRLQEILAQLKTGVVKENMSEFLAKEIAAVERLKMLAIYVAGVAVQKCAETLDERQSILALVSDLAIEVFALESGLMRAVKIRRLKGEAVAEIPAAICRVALAERVPLLFSRARQGLINIAEGNEAEFEPYAKALDRLLAVLVTDTEKEREAIAARMIEKDGYQL